MGKLPIEINKRGSILIGMLLVFPFLILITLYYMSLGTSNFRVATKDQSQTQSQFAADAGLDRAFEEINNDPTWTGTGGEITLHNEASVKTTYEMSVVDSGDRKLVTSIGRSYKPSTSTTPASTIKIEAEMRSVSSGEYSVVSGVGGLVMSNSAKILGGDIYINGIISLSNSAQIGLTGSPVNINVAHNSCPNPADATYPRICNSGENGQPITINNSAKIYGTVRANNQTNGTSMFNPGLVAGSGVAAEALPTHDRDAQKAAALPPVAPYTGNWSCNSGTYTWPANVKITGNVSISNNCKVTALGNVWITGTLTTSNSAELIVSDSLGTTRPVIMFDGALADFKNSSTLKSNTSGTGFMIIAYKSDASCSPDCSDVTGTDLKNSQSDERISLDNSASGPNTIFYARWSKVTVHNSGQLGALIGQTVELANSGTITFGTSTGTSTSYWVLDGYRRKFN